MTPLDELRAAVVAAASALASGAGPRGVPTLERPPRPEFGDYSTNAALLLAPILGEPPRPVAERLGIELAARLQGGVARVEVAGPGFLNLFLDDGWFRSALLRVIADGDHYGGGGAARRERISVEFVSANPTGPLTVASGRHAAYGDALARILLFHGHDVVREYYVNDHGSQVIRLAESIRALARGEQVPEDGYHGDYVAGLVDRERALELDLPALAREAVAACVAMIRATLERFGVHHDLWFFESSVYEGEPSEVQRTLDQLESRGESYCRDDALWLRTSAHGDDKDRVLRRSSGELTYFAPDVAYHQDKLARGFERLIDVWGADHHGYVARMRAALEALGAPPDTLEIVLLQFMHLVEDGERSAVSKRSGVIVTLDGLMADIGVDAARYFLLARSHETTLDLDLDLARSQNSDNPVYYVQYAHARVASLLDRAGPERVAQALADVGASEPQSGGVDGASPPDGEPLQPGERTLIKKILALPWEVGEAAQRRTPHRIAAYSLELAQDFTAFYRDCRVVGAQPREVESFRLVLSLAARDALARSLHLLGVSAPDQM